MSETIIIDKALSKEEKYKQLLPQIKSLVEGENDLIANLANICAALKYGMDGFFWVGFYFIKGDELVLGPFQGPVACTRIKLAGGLPTEASAQAGVCGTAVKEKRTIVVDDVNTFPGHIACSADSKSEIVIPIFIRKTAEGGQTGFDIFGVLDIDSDSYSNFDSVDAGYLEEVCNVVSQLINK